MKNHKSLLGIIGGAGVLLGAGRAQAAITVLDPLSQTNNLALATGNVAFSDPFTVSSGASLLVFEVMDTNSGGGGAGVPVAPTWDGQTLALADSQNPAQFTNRAVSIFYLYNPTAATNAIAGTIPNNSSGVDYLAAFTLTGTVTSGAPSIGAIDKAGAGTVTPPSTASVIPTPTALVSGSYAAVASAFGATGDTLSFSDTFGGTPNAKSTNVSGSTESEGYLPITSSGSDTINAAVTGSAAASKFVFTTAVFAPAASLSNHAIISLTAAAPSGYGSAVPGGPLVVTGNNGNYQPVAQTGVFTGIQKGTVEGMTFNPVSDTEIYALALSDSGNLATDLAALVTDINSGNGTDGVPASGVVASTTMVNDPFGSQYNLFLTFSGVNAPVAGDNFLGFDLSEDPGLSGLTVTEAALIPEPASTGLLLVGAMGMLARRRRAQTV